MNIMELLQQQTGDGGLEALGRQFGLEPDQTRQLAGQLAPAVAGGARRRAREDGGLHALLRSLEGDAETRYVEDPSAAAAPEGRARGEAFLRDLLGSDDGPQRLAEAAAKRDGFQAETVGAFLPALAAVIQGAMQRQAPDEEIRAVRGQVTPEMDRAGSGLSEMFAAASTEGGGAAGSGLGGLMNQVLGALSGGGDRSAAPPGGGGQLGSLLMMLDRDGDGSPFDDVLDMIARR